MTLIIILMVIFVVYQCLSTKIVQTKQTHFVRVFFTKVSTVTPNYEKIKKGIVRGRSTLRDPICCIFFLCVPFLKDCLFLISSWDTGTSRAACSSQDWDHGKEHLLGFPSSDSLQWLSSATLYLLDYPSNWWNFILFNGWVIILLKIYKHAFLISMLIKYPCFTRDLGPLRPSFYLRILLQSMETYWAHFLTRAFWPPWEDALCLREWYKSCVWALLVFHVTQGILLFLSFSLFLFVDSSPQVPVCKRLQHSHSCFSFLIALLKWLPSSQNCAVHLVFTSPRKHSLKLPSLVSIIHSRKKGHAWCDHLKDHQNQSQEHLTPTVTILKISEVKNASLIYPDPYLWSWFPPSNYKTPCCSLSREGTVCRTLTCSGLLCLAQ